MEKIIIDENFNGIYKQDKQDWYFKIDIDISFPNAHIEVNIPLVTRSIKGKSLKVGEWLEVIS